MAGVCGGGWSEEPLSAAATDATGDLGDKPLVDDTALLLRIESEEPGWPSTFDEVVGGPRLVDRFTISFPFTMRLSLDFFKSLVSISKTYFERRIIHISHVTKQHTISAHLKIHDRPYTDIDDTEKPLIFLFEFLLVEDLNGQNTFLISSPTRCQ